MLKTIVLLILVVSAFTQFTNKEILQFGLDGAFDRNSISDPSRDTVIDQCFTEESAAITVAYIGQLFNQAASSDLTGLIALIPQMAAFGHSLPSAVKSCFATNPQILALVH